MSGNTGFGLLLLSELIVASSLLLLDSAEAAPQRMIIPKGSFHLGKGSSTNVVAYCMDVLRDTPRPQDTYSQLLTKPGGVWVRTSRGRVPLEAALATGKLKVSGADSSSDYFGVEIASHSSVAIENAFGEDVDLIVEESPVLSTVKEQAPTVPPDLRGVHYSDAKQRMLWGPDLAHLTKSLKAAGFGPNPDFDELEMLAGFRASQHVPTSVSNEDLVKYLDDFVRLNSHTLRSSRGQLLLIGNGAEDPTFLAVNLASSKVVYYGESADELAAALTASGPHGSVFLNFVGFAPGKGEALELSLRLNDRVKKSGTRIVATFESSAPELIAIRLRSEAKVEAVEIDDGAATITLSTASGGANLNVTLRLRDRVKEILTRFVARLRELLRTKMSIDQAAAQAREEIAKTYGFSKELLEIEIRTEFGAQQFGELIDGLARPHSRSG